MTNLAFILRHDDKILPIFVTHIDGLLEPFDASNQQLSNIGGDDSQCLSLAAAIFNVPFGHQLGDEFSMAVNDFDLMAMLRCADQVEQSLHVNHDHHQGQTDGNGLELIINNFMRNTF